MGHLLDFRAHFFKERPAKSKASLRALHSLWQELELPEDALDHVRLHGVDPVLPSSFALGTAAQTCIAAAALAAAEVWHLRGRQRQSVIVPMQHAAQECRSYFTVNGVEPDPWDKITGLYQCGDGVWIRVHANFPHHRDGILTLTGCQAGPYATREQFAQALTRWKAAELEDVAAQAGLVVAIVRTFDEWDAHPQSLALASQRLVSLERIGDADPRPLAKYKGAARPLSDIRVLDLTRIIAGPVCGRALAAYGADVMLVNSPNLPNIDAIADTSRGKLSVHADLETAGGRITLGNLLRSSHIFVQAYRPGAMEALGFGPDDVARQRPGIVYTSLSAYGYTGPWAPRRGLDSLVQTAMGFNHAEALAAGQSEPRSLPVQILNHAAGYLMAFGAQAALARQATEGGSWHVRVSLARTAQWLRSLGRVPSGLSYAIPDIEDLLETSDSGFGSLRALKHAASFSDTPAQWDRPSSPPGTHPAVWPVHS